MKKTMKNDAGNPSPTYFHNQNNTDCSDQKGKGPSSLSTSFNEF
jgi:hypothetical protein